MRISDWSSDVCSSDLEPARLHRRQHRRLHEHPRGLPPQRRRAPGLRLVELGLRQQPQAAVRGRGQRRPPGEHVREIGRHTSELQSLMRISYAVFCLKKKKKKKLKNKIENNTNYTAKKTY